MKYSIDVLELFMDSKKMPASLEVKIQIILDSINDWPDQIENLDFFAEVLLNSVGDQLTKRNIENHILKLNINGDAWKIESLTQLLPLFVESRESTLNEIFFNIQKELTFFSETSSLAIQ